MLILHVPDDLERPLAMPPRHADFERRPGRRERRDFTPVLQLPIAARDRRMAKRADRDERGAGFELDRRAARWTRGLDALHGTAPMISVDLTTCPPRVCRRTTTRHSPKLAV